MSKWVVWIALHDMFFFMNIYSFSKMVESHGTDSEDYGVKVIFLDEGEKPLQCHLCDYRSGVPFSLYLKLL